MTFCFNFEFFANCTVIVEYSISIMLVTTVSLYHHKEETTYVLMVRMFVIL